MKTYLYETHCHTCDVSRCARIGAREMVAEYVRAGYAGVVVTNHFNAATFADLGELPPGRMADHFLSGWRAARDAAPAGFTVLPGMELTFHENHNDFLIYGIDEEFVYRFAGDLMGMGLRAFRRVADENGLLVVQAHPFRNGMTIGDPKLRDGVEVYNGNPRHDSRNDIALAWAEKFGLLKTSGSDYHQREDLARGGIYLERPIADNAELLAALREGPRLLTGPLDVKR